MPKPGASEGSSRPFTGELVLGDAPGWGMDIREEVALAHAVKR
jgi:hypothetical protein